MLRYSTNRNREPPTHIAWFRDATLGARLGGGTLRILSVTSQSAVCEKQYDDFGYLRESDLRQFIDTNEGKLTAADLERKLERKLRIRLKRDGVFYKTGDDEIRLATVVGDRWFCSTSGRHIAIQVEAKLYFYELVQ
ncbi:unnamed protein product [Chondrus crispus]|uniref:Uncharacterized protein n=1 Tax=Chondrus crispus TaxID=2769 RepID=R7QPG5_CHOCR|nr:unnamed protein product [Chondrus crispus]CDF40382.1 unnamed protein product [Chondrus crispus]|eukprot:XP_005710676.1 unnamed protein product [Chondrus crispus]